MSREEGAVYVVQGQSFLKAEEILLSAGANVVKLECLMPYYQLLHQVAELIMKAKLCSSGYDSKVNHDLSALMAECNTAGILLSDNFVSIVTSLEHGNNLPAPYGEKHTYRYLKGATRVGEGLAVSFVFSGRDLASGLEALKIQLAGVEQKYKNSTKASPAACC